ETAFVVVARRVVRQGDAPALVTISLEHRDAALTVPLYRAPDIDDVIAEWQLWGRVLRLPLLVADLDGGLSEPFARLGHMRVETPAPRRRRRNAVKARHPTILLRRRMAALPPSPRVHRGEREIIARA